MAQATIRVNLDKTFEIFHDQDTENNLIQWIIDNEILNEEFLEACIDAFIVESADFEEEEITEDKKE